MTGTGTTAFFHPGWGSGGRKSATAEPGYAPSTVGGAQPGYGQASYANQQGGYAAPTHTGGGLTGTGTAGAAPAAAAPSSGTTMFGFGRGNNAGAGVDVPPPAYGKDGTGYAPVRFPFHFLRLKRRKADGRSNFVARWRAPGALCSACWEPWGWVCGGV